MIVQREKSAIAIQFIEDPADPRVAAYRDIRERDLTGREGLFVAEGEVVIRTLLSPSSLCRARSLLIAANRVEAQAELIAAAGAGVPVYAASQGVIDAIAGFPLHRGLLALGEKPAERPVDAVLARLPEHCVVLAAAGIGNHDNMGGLFRNAAAFGAAAVLRDERCCDPFYRKAIRVSVGAVLRTPSAASTSLAGLIAALEAERFQVIALSPGATEPLVGLSGGGRKAVLVGSEGPGLPPAVMERVKTVGIPMAGGFDSLNVAVTSALALYQITTVSDR
ncbi:RNA methyltransferase [Brevundimonas sp. NIBR11]|uniref:TrmH family RNA methyltransferase n=1 Tax=Brevundimonas sp. NIBR11 TaxID=3015999 RepID=UPI0022F114A6|nr:RNA methyltransferase [Brevundimonas sp. NIBR11]WGM31229.1 23S rRNA (guanosine-2'-O-)-methyltransferase RlmB [Brevundimonas sp. NIBR11]